MSPMDHEIESPPSTSARIVLDEPDLPLSQVDSLSGPQLRRAMVLAAVAWIFGSVWVNTTSGAPFTLFARGLGASDFEFGLLTAMPYIASLLSMPASLLIERTGQRKSIFLGGLYGMRLLWLPLAVGPYLIIRQFGFADARLAMLAFMPLYF